MATTSRKVKDNWLDEKDRREGLKSLFYFGKFILGYDLEVNPHKEVCDFIQDETCRKKLLLLPRGSFKTTIVSQILPVWLIIKNPNIRILLDSEVLKNSERNLAVIKNTLVRNKRLRHLYGVHIESVDGNQSEFTSRRRENFSLREPTVGTSSVDTVEVGPHWDVVLPDDLHSEKNSKTKTQIDHVYEHFRLLFSLLDPGKPIYLVGTRWSDLDTYGRIKEFHKDFKVMERKAIKDDGSLFFPKRLTHEVLEDIRKVQGLEMFSAQYQNDPLPQGENASFRKEWFRYSEHLDCNLILTVDPAVGASRSADHTALVVAGLSSRNDLFLEDYFGGILQPYATIEKIFSFLDKYKGRIKAVAIETNAFQKMMKFALEAEMKKRGKFTRIIELKHSKAKEERIMALQPRYEQGAIYHKAWMKGGALEEELIKFPKGRRDDLIDAFASVLEVLKPHSLKYPGMRARQLREQNQKQELRNLRDKKDESMDARIEYALAMKRYQSRKKKTIHPMMGDIY